jgi:hypothetical protein
LERGVITSNNNIIGNQSALSSLVFTTSSSASTEIYGMYKETGQSNNNWTVNNNSIGGITATSTTNTLSLFLVCGIKSLSDINDTCFANSNVVGGSIANSIQNNSFSLGAQVIGIMSDRPILEATSNIVRNLSVAGGAGTVTSASAIGILVYTAGVADAHKLIQNTIYGLTNSSTLVNQINGIIFRGSNVASNIIERNIIYGLNTSSTNTTSSINGIYVDLGLGTYRNNMIDIGLGVNTAIVISGINEVGGNNNFWHNSIYIGGNPTTGTSNSFAFNSTVTSNTRSFRNNIFWNARSNSGATGKNYIVRVGGTAANPAGLTINNNVYYGTGTGSVFGLFNSVDRANLTAWRSAVGQDVDSFNEDPKYIDPTNVTVPDFHIQPVSCKNVIYTGALLGVITDFDNDARSVTAPVIGADEVSNNSTIWTGTAWTNSAPTITKAALIIGNYNSTTLSSIDACSLRINSPATVTIAANKYVNIDTDLTVRTGATLDVLHQGSLVMIDDNGIVTNNGTMRVYKTTQPYERFDYTYWSSPMTNCTIASVLSAWRNDYTFRFEPANFVDLNDDGFDDNLDAWVFVPQSTTMATGKGYIAMAPTTGTFPTTNTVTFLGTVNNGIITTPISLSGDTARTNDDFNLIGNPYPSSIYANEFITDNLNISGTLYFWTHIKDIDLSPANPGPQLYNFRPDDYALYNLTGGTASVNGGLPPSGYIASGQGFLVEAVTAGNVTFNNDLRKPSYINTNFYKNANKEVVKDRVWLSLQNDLGMFSQQLIGYIPETTLGFDRAYDGLRGKAQTFVHFYSIIEGEEYKIQSRGNFDINDRVPLGYQSEYAGEFKIKIDGIEGILNTLDANVYLEDKELNVIHNLKESDYTFTTTVGKFDNRFVLLYANQVLGNTDFNDIQKSVFVFTSNDQIEISSPSKLIKEYEIHDVLGRRLDVKNNINKNTTTSSIAKNNQTLIVKIVLENGQWLIRKIIF